MSPAIDLRRKYGEGKLRQVINRAIRAEIPGGSQTLDGLELLHKILRRIGETEPGGGPTIAKVAYDRLCEIADAMESEIRKRYGLTQPRPPGAQ